MAILRHAPGERVPISGTYALVHHFGEPTAFSVEVKGGDRFPLVSTGTTGPMWFVLVDVPQEAAKAA